MKVAFVTSSVSRRAGGLFFSVRRLTQTLAASGQAQVEVLGIEDDATRKDLPEWGETAPRVLRCRGPAAFGYAPGMAPALAGYGGDLVHTQGLWMYPSAVVHRWSRHLGRPYLISPRGMLDPWAVRNARWKKRLAGWAYEHAHLRGAACLHALCAAEAEAIRAYGLRNPVCVIPNGVDLPDRVADEEPPAWASAIPAGAQVLLYLGRLHPKKGLPVLLDGWQLARAEAQSGGWHLVIAGWDQGGHQAELAAQIERAGLQAQVHLVGPQFGAQKAASLERADAFVLPSFSEGLPMTVLEAWARRLPVLMTPACNLAEGFAAGAALQMAPEPDSIATALRRGFAMSDAERAAMGEQGRRLVADRFTWPRVAEQLLAVYRWVLGQGPQPDSVRLD
jgi:poly(glycerol-phosphate) alpha-glucosyltransferase